MNNNNYNDYNLTNIPNNISYMEKPEFNNSNLFTQYNKRVNFNNDNNISFNKKSRILRNKNTRTPILLRRNKTFNDINLNEIGINDNTNKIYNNNYNSNNDNLYKYKINDIKKININNRNINNNREETNSVKYTTTSGGSIVSIHNNKIHGLPILQGVCPKCINSELIILKELNKKIKKFSPIQDYNNYDMLENEKQRNNELKERILLKVKYNKNRLLPETQNYEKNKLIENNSKAECKLFKPAGDPIKDRVLDNFFKKEKYLRNKKMIPYNINLDVDKYLKNNNNNVTKFSVPSIGLEQHKNKYLPTIEQYLSELSKQVINKKNLEEIEKKKEKDEFNNNFKQIMIKANNDYESQYLIERQKKQDYLFANKRLMEMKQNQKLMDKSMDIITEQKRLKIIAEQEKNELEKQKTKKYKIKKELMEKLGEQIKLKRYKSFDSRHSNNNGNINDNNNSFIIYGENKKNEQFGRCLKCLKLLRKNQICPKEEYDLIKNIEIDNQQILNKMINKYDYKSQN